MCKFYKKFFKNESVKFGEPFPKSCFSSLNFENSLEFPYLVKGKDRLYCFMPKKYNNFISNVGMDKLIKEFNSYPYRQNRKNLFSYTDIYNKNDAKINNKTKTYCQLMIKKWLEYKKCIINFSKQYCNICYFDIENFYSSLYVHWILGICLNNIDEFRYFKKINDDTKRKNYISKKSRMLCDFHKNFNENIIFYKETKGIPIGNGISDFFSEQILQLVEFFVSNEVDISNIKIVRFRDDIWLFGNNKAKINKIFYKYKSVLLEFKLFINSKTIFADALHDRSRLVSDKTYTHEEAFINEVMQDDLLFGITSFSMKYPNSNKIFKWLSKLYNNIDKYEPSAILKTMAKLFKYSKTCVIPWIVAILDKINFDKKEKLIIHFFNSIDLYKLSISDIIWLACLSKKYKIDCVPFNQIINKLDIDTKNLINNIDNIDKCDFRKDADTFFYE